MRLATTLSLTLLVCSVWSCRPDAADTPSAQPQAQPQVQSEPQAQLQVSPALSDTESARRSVRRGFGRLQRHGAGCYALSEGHSARNKGASYRWFKR